MDGYIIKTYIENNWNSILEELNVVYELSPIAIDTWIRPCRDKIVRVKDNTITLEFDSVQVVQIINKKYVRVLEEVLSERFDGEDIHISLEVKNEDVH